MIRDQALALGGLLVERIGGPSVKPYQPRGPVERAGRRRTTSRTTGPSLYRRSLYTFWKRTVPPPAMVDLRRRRPRDLRRARGRGPTRRSRRSTLLNDVTYVEAARGLAERMMREGGDDARGAARRGVPRWRPAGGRGPRSWRSCSTALATSSARFRARPAGGRRS